MMFRFRTMKDLRSDQRGFGPVAGFLIWLGVDVIATFVSTWFFSGNEANNVVYLRQMDFDYFIENYWVAFVVMFGWLIFCFWLAFPHGRKKSRRFV
jgi:hypothetical protein